MLWGHYSSPLACCENLINHSFDSDTPEVRNPLILTSPSLHSLLSPWFSIHSCVFGQLDLAVMFVE